MRLPHAALAGLLALGACAAPRPVVTPLDGPPLTLADADTLARFAPAHPEAVRAYGRLLAAADSSLSPADSARVRRHLARLGAIAPDLTLDDARLKTWPVGTGSDALRWWRDNDPFPSTPRNERVPEHLARGAEAEAEYGTRIHASGLDGRGRLLLRLGAPGWTRRLTSLPLRTDQWLALRDQLSFSEAWGYPLPETDLVYLFVGRGGAYEEATPRQLLPIVLQGGSSLGPQGEIRERLTAVGLRDLLRPVSGFVPEYGAIWDDAMAYLDGFGNPILRSDRVDLGEIDAQTERYLDRRDAAAPAFLSTAGGALPGADVAVRTARFRTAGGATRLDVLWAPSPEGLTLSPVEAASLPAFGGTKTVTGLASRLVVQDADVRTLAVVTDRAPVGGTASPTQVTSLQIGPEAVRLALEVDALAGDTTVARRSVVRLGAVEPLAPTGFEVSDLVPLRLAPDALDVDLDDRLARQLALFALPGDRLGAGEPLAVLVEVYGLAPGADGRAHYTVAYEVARERPRGGVAGLLGRTVEEQTGSRFTASADGTDARELIGLDLSTLPDDARRIEVSVEVRDETTGEVRARVLRLDLAAPPLP